MTKKPHALAIVYCLENDAGVGYTDKDVARELRRLHEVNVELLAACEDALVFLESWKDLSGGYAYRKVFAAIAKATGETE